jgi:energy-converting hydrogenase Eha subunit A
MGALDLIFHLLNFAIPALVVSVLVALVSPLIYRKRTAAPAKYAQVAINFVVGLLALGTALVFFGRDGKMAAYTALVLAVASCQWWASRR